MSKLIYLTSLVMQELGSSAYAFQKNEDSNFIVYSLNRLAWAWILIC